MSKSVEITKENFNDVVTSNDLVVLDFWADWCGPCRQFAPIYDEASEQYPDVVFGKIDTEAQPELVAAFNIHSIPTLMIIRDRTTVLSQAGALPADALAEVILQARELKVDSTPRAAE
ncbi:thioredoxin [Streptomyces sp. NPDC001914]|uniref:thioredoxin n=1 Tax=Streptomyces sp. NPDC001914 TaxID=3364623 RepID=UPI00369E208C